MDLATCQTQQPGQNPMSRCIFVHKPASEQTFKRVHGTIWTCPTCGKQYTFKLQSIEPMPHIKSEGYWTSV